MTVLDLHLDAAEAEQLERMLRTQLGDLRMQIADTDTSTFREHLRAEKAIVLGLLEKMSVDAAGAP